MLNGKSLLVTGGTGSFGKAFVSAVIERYPDIQRLVVFSRDELKQYEMSQESPFNECSALRFFIGDVRDRSRLRRSLTNIDYVVHAAALKQVPAAEYNPIEFINTNVLGATNVIEAAIDTGVSRVLALSTDKAAAPINLYGATKLCSDKLFVAANQYAGTGSKFSVVRYGNVMGSRGSVVPLFLKQAQEGVLSLTDVRMTRFNITLKEGVDLVLQALATAQGGEIFVPKIPSYRITDLAEAIGPSCKRKIIGIRPGEKIHEELITESDSLTTVDLGNLYAILPVANWKSSLEDDISQSFGTDQFPGNSPALPVEEGYTLTSENNGEFLTVEKLRMLIREHIDSSFLPL